MQPALAISQVGAQTTASTTTQFQRTSSSADPTTLVARSPLATRAHRLLGLGATGQSQLGQAQPALTNAFGGDPVTWNRVGDPWVAARSLARPVETLSSQSSASWLLSNGR